MPILTTDFAETRLGAWRLSNNTWNASPLVNGVDYTQTVTYGTTLPGTRFAWDYGATPATRVLAYPELILGAKPWDASRSNPLTTRLDALRQMEVDYDLTISGQTGAFNLAFDLWLTDRKAGGEAAITTEVMVWLHRGNLADGVSENLSRMSVGGKGADVLMRDGHQATAGGPSWRYVAVLLDETTLKGRIDLDAILRHLIRIGHIDGKDWISGIEFGAEVTTGRGGFTVRDFTADTARYAISDAANRITGTPEADVIHSRGGADTLAGGAGGDWLTGGLGADRLTGGGGADRFIFETAADSRPTSPDQITDFTRVDGLDLALIDANTTLSGNQRFHLAARLDGPGALVLHQTSTGAQIRADTNGDGQADLVIHVTGQITAADIVL